MVWRSEELIKTETHILVEIDKLIPFITETLSRYNLYTEYSQMTTLMLRIGRVLYITQATYEDASYNRFFGSFQKRGIIKAMDTFIGSLVGIAECNKELSIYRSFEIYGNRLIYNKYYNNDLIRHEYFDTIFPSEYLTSVYLMNSTIHNIPMESINELFKLHSIINSEQCYDSVISIPLTVYNDWHKIYNVPENFLYQDDILGRADYKRFRERRHDIYKAAIHTTCDAIGEIYGGYGKSLRDKSSDLQEILLVALKNSETIHGRKNDRI